MVSLHPALKKAYWGLAGAGALYAVFMLCLTNVTIQRKYANSSRDSPCSKTSCSTLQRSALYANKLVSAWWANVDTPQAYGFASQSLSTAA